MKKNEVLFAAIKNRYTEIGDIESLLEDGADVNAISPYNGETPLHVAVFWGRADIAELLLQRGAEVNAKLTTSQKLANCRSDEAVTNGETPLHLAAGFGRSDIVWILLQYHADVRARTSQKDTPLHCAAAQGYSAVIPLLIKAGAELDALNSNGKAPGDVAINKADKEIIQCSVGIKQDIAKAFYIGSSSMNIVFFSVLDDEQAQLSTEDEEEEDEAEQAQSYTGKRRSRSYSC
jgi:ankyrin repeat protein